MSAEEVRSLFGDIVEGLSFLVGHSCLVLLSVSYIGIVLARQVDIASGSEAGKCASDVG